MREPKTRIFIVDDHPLIRRGMKDLISHEPDFLVCGEAGSVPEALSLLDRADPDAIVVDITLNGGNGIDLIKQLKARRRNVRIVVTTMHDESLFGERCFRAGAMGYVNKEEASEKVVEALRSVLDGRLFLSERLAERVVYRALGVDEKPDGSPLARLTDREIEVFSLIGSGKSTRQIAEMLHLSHKTIESYRENIKAKLRLQNAVELTRQAIQWVMENE